MSDIDIAVLGAVSQAADGSVRVQAQIPVANDNGENDVEPFGEIQIMQGLGLTSAPWPRDEKGYAEGVIARGCGGRNAVCLGARDTRTAAIVGNLKPGDTVLHSTGPNQSAQVQCKEEKRQVVLATIGTDGKQILVIADGKNDKIQVLAFGAVWEMKRDGGGAEINFSNGLGAGLQLKGNSVVVDGNFFANRNAKFPLQSAAGPVTGTSGVTVPVAGAFG